MLTTTVEEVTSSSQYCDTDMVYYIYMYSYLKLAIPT